MQRYDIEKALRMFVGDEIIFSGRDTCRTYELIENLTNLLSFNDLDLLVKQLNIEVK